MVHLPKRNSFQLQSLSQRGVAQLLLLILLITGIGIGTVVVQQRTNILPQASDDDEEDEEEGYEGERASEPEHAETNIASEKAETEQRDDGGGEEKSPSDDGSTFQNQSDETKEAFRKAYPNDPEGAWNAEHAEELRTGKTADGRDIVGGKPVEKDRDGDGDIDVADAALQVQMARANQEAIDKALADRNAAEQAFNEATAREDFEAASVAYNEMLAAEDRISELGGSYEAAVALTHAKEADFNKAVENATADTNIPSDELGSVIGYIASLNGKSLDEAAQEAAQAIRDRGGTGVGAAAGMAVSAAGGSPQESMSASANAVAQGGETDPAQVLSAAIATGTALKTLSNDQIADQVRKIGEQKGYSEDEIAQGLSQIPGLQNRSSAETQDVSESIINNTQGEVANPAPAPAPAAVPAPVAPPVNQTISSTNSSSGKLNGEVNTTSVTNVEGKTFNDTVGVYTYNRVGDEKIEPGDYIVSVTISTPAAGGSSEALVTISNYKGQEENIQSVNPNEISTDGKIDANKVESYVSTRSPARP